MEITSNMIRFGAAALGGTLAGGVAFGLSNAKFNKKIEKQVSELSQDQIEAIIADARGEETTEEKKPVEKVEAEVVDAPKVEAEVVTESVEEAAINLINKTAAEAINQVKAANAEQPKPAKFTTIRE